MYRNIEKAIDSFDYTEPSEALRATRLADLLGELLQIDECFAALTHLCNDIPAETHPVDTFIVHDRVLTYWYTCREEVLPLVQFHANHEILWDYSRMSKERLEEVAAFFPMGTAALLTKVVEFTGAERHVGKPALFDLKEMLRDSETFYRFDHKVCVNSKYFENTDEFIKEVL